MSPAPEKRAAIILNASSGSDGKEAMERQVRKIFLDHGWNCTVEMVKAGTDIGEICRRVIRDGATRIVAGGGDGTLRAVASAVAGTGVAMAVLPVGTLNHFARDLEIPIDEEAAIRIAAVNGVEVAVDYGEVNGRGFINNCVLGLYPAYRSQRDLHERLGWSSIPSILAGFGSILSRFPNLELNFRSEGMNLCRRTAWVLIANNAHAMEGYKPWQREKLTAGDLWVYILRDRGRFELVRLFIKLVLGGSLAGDEFEVLSASDLVIDARRRWLAVSLDGEVFWLPSPLRFSSRPLELRVVVPPDSKRVSEAVCELPGGVPSVG
jgi:diacylglycerol kinase family enzyme